MTVLVGLFFLAAVAACYVFFTSQRLGRTEFSGATLYVLTPNVERVLQQSEAWAESLEKTARIRITFTELATIWRNSRILLLQLDSLRFDESDEESTCAALHSQMLEAHLRTNRLLHRALLERLSTLFSSHPVQLYGAATICSYGYELAIVENIRDVCALSEYTFKD